MARGQKKAEEEGRTILWVDESGFYLLPSVVRTYAPRGKTPVLTVPLTHDHLSAISAISPDGNLYLSVQDRAYNSKDVVRFLERVLSHIAGLVTIIWDGSPIHRSKVIKDYLASGAARRVHLERLPGYAPDLNPDEGIWRYLKRVELRNLCCSDLEELRRELRLAVGRLRYRRHIIKSCIKEAGYHV
jgi:transposase